MLDRLDLDENLNLVVRNVEWDDGGEYVCDVSAQNITHSGQGSTMLIVQGKSVCLFTCLEYCYAYVGVL